MRLKLDKRCACINPRISLFIFGYLSLLYHCISILFCCYVICIIINLENEDDEVAYGLSSLSLTKLLIFSICLNVKTFSIPFTILLLLGAHTKNRVYLKNYLYYSVTDLVFSFLLTLAYLFSIEIDRYILTFIICDLVLPFFFLNVIHIYYSRI